MDYWYHFCYTHITYTYAYYSILKVIAAVLLIYIADFATLLTGRTSSMFRRDDGSPSVGLQQNTNNNYVATGRFTFHRKNLFYSFYVSDPLYRPRALQFADFEGNILGEQALFIDGVTSVYQNVTGKVIIYLFRILI
jgi:hypothetical protein